MSKQGEGTAMYGTANGQGSNSAAVRQFNERMVLSTLRRLGEASKADLARSVNLTQNAAGQIVRELESQKLICLAGKRTGLRGQPATLLRLDPRGAYSIGVKLGRRSLDALLVDFSGRVLLARRQECAFPLPDRALEMLLEDIAILRAHIPPDERGRLMGIGLALPYDLGSWRRELDIPPETCAAWIGFDLGARLRERLDVPVLVENDGTAVAIAELFQGHGRELDDFACIFIGTAIGGGLVLSGSYRRGAQANAGDIGLMPVSPSRLSTAPQPSGVFDILLNRASISTLIRHLVEAGGETITDTASMEAAMLRQPALLEEWLDDCTDALIAPLLSIGTLLDLQAIVLDGNLPRPLIETMVERQRDLLAVAAAEARRPPELRIGRVGRNAAALGAAILPLHNSYAPDQQLLFGA